MRKDLGFNELDEKNVKVLIESCLEKLSNNLLNLETWKAHKPSDEALNGQLLIHVKENALK